MLGSVTLPGTSSTLSLSVAGSLVMTGASRLPGMAPRSSTLTAADVAVFVAYPLAVATPRTVIALVKSSVATV